MLLGGFGACRKEYTVPDFPGLRKIQGYERLRCEIEALKIEAQALPDERIGTIQAGEC